MTAKTPEPKGRSHGLLVALARNVVARKRLLLLVPRQIASFWLKLLVTDVNPRVGQGLEDVRLHQSNKPQRHTRERGGGTQRGEGESKARRRGTSENPANDLVEIHGRSWRWKIMETRGEIMETHGDPWKQQAKEDHGDSWRSMEDHGTHGGKYS